MAIDGSKDRNAPRREVSSNDTEEMTSSVGPGGGQVGGSRKALDLEEMVIIHH